MIKDIEGFDGLYAITDRGEVWSYPKKDYRNPHNGKFLKQSKDSEGYMQVSLHDNGKKMRGVIHRLVARAFIPKKEGTDQINHIDGDKTNNNVSNLEWCTGAENVAHAYRLGLSSSGQRHYKSKLSREQVIEIREIKKTGITNKVLANKFKVSHQAIGHIIRGENWKHV